MKRFYLQGLALIISFIALMYVINVIDTRYTREARVDSIEGNVITFEDENGNFWEWEKEENEKEYKVKERVVLKMDTKGTDRVIEDDVIRRVKRGV